MQHSVHHRPRKSPHPARGFALAVVLALMVLLTLLAVGMLSLASVSLRNSGQLSDMARAKANARLAMMLALGELQRQTGADTRTTAQAAMFEGSERVPNRQWTGAWSTRSKTGGPLLVRDDASGGLKDTRDTTGDREKQALTWLVSGNGVLPTVHPRLTSLENPIRLVGPSSLGGKSPLEEVHAPGVAVGDSAGKAGHFAWWVGDLGTKANIATPDAFEDHKPDPNLADGGGWFRLMTSQEADAAAITGEEPLDAKRKSRLASDATTELALTKNKAALARRFHDFTTQSAGLLTNVAEGGLKRDLTAYFASNGNIPERNGLPGISDKDNLVGPANSADASRMGLTWTDTRHRFTSPKFGLLRRWATIQAPFRNATIDAITPKTEPTPQVTASDKLALANLKPATIAEADTPNLSPILVEGSMFYNMSYHKATPRPGQTKPAHPYQVRLHVYPRIVLWNPYNANLTLDRTIAMIQGNGRHEMWTDGYMMLGSSRFQVTAQWIWFEGGRSTDFTSGDGSILNSKGYTDPYMGCWYFSIPPTTFAPGECLVFSPERSAEYARPPFANSNNYSLETNTLTCTKPPHPSRSYYTSDSEIDGGIDFVPTYYWFAPTRAWSAEGIRNQGDDCRVILKKLGNQTGITFEVFDALPQISLLSASLQYGGGREPRISWSVNEKMVVEETGTTDVASQPLKIPPNVRTRDGVRLRWFDEHASNLIGSGSLRNTAHFQDALLANWNPRAAYVTRSPYENIAGTMPVSGNLGGPWFFGAYTRDLYDAAVGWDEQTPVPRGGRYHGNPFGPPQESGGRPIVLFDVPRKGTGVVSLGQLQHAKLSEFVWHPTYAIGNSLADPRLASGPLSGLDRTAPKFASSTETRKGGFDSNAIGWSSDTQRSADRESWATQGRAIFQDYPDTDNLVYDLSFEVNQTLWDAYFLSTGDEAAKGDFLTGTTREPLPNGRMVPAPVTGPAATTADLTDFHRAARFLAVDGAFNVNSTSVEAWKAILGATRRLARDGKSAAFPRVLSPQGGEWSSGTSTDADSAWTGLRALSDDELDRLARAIVAEVCKRGPFLSLADFVNRRLANDTTGKMGALEAAIQSAGLNNPFRSEFPLDNTKSLPNYRHPDNIQDATRFEQTLKPDCKVWGIPGYLTQADLLQVLGPMLAARSDTFVIRCYGDATDASGRIVARAWCEAVVQRCPEPITPDASGINPLQSSTAADFGRRYVVKSFRWLNPEEV